MDRPEPLTAFQVELARIFFTLDVADARFSHNLSGYSDLQGAKAHRVCDRGPVSRR